MATSLVASVLELCPSWLIKAAREGTYDCVLVVFNNSLREKVVPLALKEAVVCCLLKEPSRVPTSLASFCPVSNLPFLGTVVEKVVTWQLQWILDKVDYLDPFQSGFRPSYGTEKAMIVLLDDLWWERDGCSVNIFAFLDLSLDVRLQNQKRDMTIL